MRIRVIGWLVLVAAAMLFLPTLSFGQYGPPTVAPPELPTYEQPLCPGDGYIWTPGYWAWDGSYYWVPGTWVMAPETGYLWTPGYWGWGGGGWMFNEGYWGLGIGFYGGINYGFGYFGHGYEGGRWQGGHFFYNTAVSHVDGAAFHNVYNARVDVSVNRVSYNGGQGGINARATTEEEAVGRGPHTGPVSAQTQHAWSAHNDPAQHASAGRSPGMTATARANMAVHPKDLPPVARPDVAKSGNAKQDQKNQKEQDKVVAKQNQDRQKLQQKQEKEDQRQTKQAANQQKTQQTEQRHQQQTQQMHQAHSQQMQQMGQRQSSGGGGAHGGGGHH